MFGWQLLAVVAGFGTGDFLLGSIASIGAIAIMALILLDGRNHVSLSQLTPAQAKPLILHNIIFLVFTLTLFAQNVLFEAAWYWYFVFPLLWILSAWEIWVARNVLKMTRREEEMRARINRGESLIDKPRPWVSAPSVPKPSIQPK